MKNLRWRLTNSNFSGTEEIFSSDFSISIVDLKIIESEENNDWEID